MNRRTLVSAVWPAVLGVLAAHQIAYAGHDDGHIHGYLETVAPALVVAAVLGWIWSWARSRVRFGTVLRLQIGLFVVMEIAERLAAVGGPVVTDLTPIVVGLALIPMVAAMTILADRAIDLVGGVAVRRVVASETGRTATVSGHASEGQHSARSIRAPPVLV